LENCVKFFAAGPETCGKFFATDPGSYDKFFLDPFVYSSTFSTFTFVRRRGLYVMASVRFPPNLKSF
jgi:hypothetical protein